MSQRKRKTSHAASGGKSAARSQRPSSALPASTAEEQPTIDNPLNPTKALTEVMNLRGMGSAMLGGEGLGGTPEIKGYKIIRRIATGGMGSVYEAEQQNPKRRVALKVLRPESSSPNHLRRFELEAEILGRLHHPGIAQIHEAGTFDSGMGPQPFFAMEFVKGVPLHKYAKERGLNEKERMELLARICDAVQHAHDAGIIHRDLKPENILITEAGQPKILDFGVARATESDARTTTMRTRIGMIIGTVSYMSPEQVGGNPEAIDARSDVYALGVLGYQLLAERLPHDFKNLALVEAARIIREEQPTPLSSISRLYRGDLETIIGKALEKEKERRYQSASEFAKDIRRYLNDEPIVARPPSTFYQLQKFAQRNKPLVGGVVLAFAALIAGLAGTTWQAIEAKRGRDSANRAEAQAQSYAQKLRVNQDALRSALDAAQSERDRSQGMFQFLLDMLQNANRRSNDGEAFTMPNLLATGDGLLREKFSGDPAIGANIHAALGDLYTEITRDDLAAQQYELAIQDLGALSPPPVQLLYSTHARLGRSHYNNHEHEQAVTHLRRALELGKSLGLDSTELRETERDLTESVRQSEGPEAALKLAAGMLEEYRQTHPEPDKNTARHQTQIAISLSQMKRGDEATAKFQEALGILRNADVPGDMQEMYAGGAYEAYITHLTAAQKWDEAQAMFHEGMLAMRASGNEIALCTLTHQYVAFLELREPRSEQGLKLLYDVLESTKRIFGQRTMRTVFVLSDLIKACWKRNRLDDYKKLEIEALAIMREKMGPGSEELVSRLGDYTAGLILKRDYDFSLGLVNEHLDLVEHQPGGKRGGLAGLLAIKAKLLSAMGDKAGAEEARSRIEAINAGQAEDVK